jgi:hypothetical protein
MRTPSHRVLSAAENELSALTTDFLAEINAVIDFRSFRRHCRAEACIGAGSSDKSTGLPAEV